MSVTLPKIDKIHYCYKTTQFSVFACVSLKSCCYELFEFTTLVFWLVILDLLPARLDKLNQIFVIKTTLRAKILKRFIGCFSFPQSQPLLWKHYKTKCCAHAGSILQTRTVRNLHKLNCGILNHFPGLFRPVDKFLILVKDDQQ